MKCKDCKHFKRLKFHKSVCENESEQKGGNCKLLKEILGMTNSSLWMADNLHVQESFGCIAFEAV